MLHWPDQTLDELSLSEAYTNADYAPELAQGC